VGEATEDFVAGLSFQPAIIYGSAIQKGGDAGFHAAGFEAYFSGGFGRAVAGKFAHASARHLLEANPIWIIPRRKAPVVRATGRPVKVLPKWQMTPSMRFLSGEHREATTLSRQKWREIRSGCHRQ